MPSSLYAFIWRESGRRQIWLCLLTGLVVPLSAAPLELQRRIVDDAIGKRDLSSMLVLCAAYLGILLLQGGLKYMLNVYRGRTVEEVVRRLRQLIYQAALKRWTAPGSSSEDSPERGALVSMVAAEAEDLGGFVGDSISVPLLQAGTVLSVLAYLLWVQPLIATFALVLYLPQLLVVPLGQRTINRFSRMHAKLLRKLGDHVVLIGPSDHPGSNPMRRFMRLANRAFDTRISIYRIKFFLTFFNNFLDAIGPLGVLLVGGWLVIAGRAEVSTLVVFISGFQKVADPWDQLVSFYRTAANALVKYRLIAEVVGPP